MGPRNGCKLLVFLSLHQRDLHSRSLGDVFLKNVYFSHNVQTNQISLAKLA